MTSLGFLLVSETSDHRIRVTKTSLFRGMDATKGLCLKQPVYQQYVLPLLPPKSKIVRTSILAEKKQLKDFSSIFAVM